MKLELLSLIFLIAGIISVIIGKVLVFGYLEILGFVCAIIGAIAFVYVSIEKL